MSSGIFQNQGRAADKTRRELATWATNKFRDCKNDRWKQERQWYLNLSFYFGHQHVVFRNTTNVAGANVFDLHVPPAPYYRVRPVINHTRRIIRKEISRLVAQKPNAFVIPATSEDRDLFAAQAGEQIWDALYRQNKVAHVIRNACFWTSVCGNGFIKQYWDATEVDPGNPDVMGNVCFKAETPYHIFVPDLKEEEIEDQPFLFHAQVKSPEWVRSVFGEEVKNQATAPNIVDESLLNVLGVNQFNMKENVLVLECWVKPHVHQWLPNGAMMTIIGDHIVQGFESWPYSHNEYPISKIDMIPTGKFYNESIIVDIIPLQRELNRTRGQIIEAKNRMAKPQLAAEMGSVDPTKITSEPGQVILYQPGMNPPVPIPLQDLPSYVLNEVERLMTDLADITGQHEVSHGSVPPGVTAATAISYLQEQDESLIAPVYTSLEEAIEKTAKQTLCYVKDYWDIPRTVKVVGVDGSFDAITFKGSQLNDNTDIKIEAGSALPTSKAAKQAFIMDLMKMEFIPPQEGLEVMEIGGINKIYERIQVDFRQAQRENIKLASVKQEQNDMHIEEMTGQIDEETGAPMTAPLIVPVNTYDNHEVHIEVHNRYRKGQSFELAPTHVKVLFEEHVKQHMEAAMGMMNPLQPPPGEEGAEEGAPPPQPGVESGSPEGGAPPPMPGPEPMPEGV